MAGVGQSEIVAGRLENQVKSPLFREFDAAGGKGMIRAGGEAVMMLRDCARKTEVTA